jgi:hypothetical protein
MTLPLYCKAERLDGGGEKAEYDAQRNGYRWLVHLDN